MAIFLIGDCHGDFTKIINFADKMKLKENDYIIVLGDMGLLWRHDRKDADNFIKFFEKNYNFNLYFVEGNHDNYKLLKLLKEDENGMGYISEHIRHLKRGREYIIENKSFLTIGGADSIDKFRRTEGLNWWKEEAITQEDIEKIEKKYYDYVLSHTCPTSIFDEYKIYLCTLGNIVDDKDPQFRISNDKLEQVKNFIDFGNWCFAHYHIDKKLNDKFTCLFNYFQQI